MRDPCGLCIRRCSFSYARAHVSRSEPSILIECNKISPFDVNDDPRQYPLPTSDDEFYSLLNASRLDLTENASAGWLKDASKNHSLGSLVPCD
jgi:hypothetical protein